LSPVILGAIVLQGASEVETQILNTTDEAVKAQLLDALASRVVMPYVIMAIVLVILSIMIWFSPLPEIDTDGEETSESSLSKNRTSVFQFPHLLLGVLCLFLYVGAEVMAGDVIGTYGKSMGLSLDETKNFTSYTLWSMVVGYIIGIITIPKYIKQEKALMWSAIVGISFSALAYLTSGYTSILFIALLGLANSLMWPAIFPMAIDGLGKFTKIGSAFLVMGIAGGAIIPLIYGSLAERIPSQSAFFFVVLPCYLYIGYYAVKGYRVGK
jgi:glucose/galactose transporter